MTKLVGILLGFFSFSGPIVQFFLWIGKKLTITSLILPIQISLIGAIITFRISLATGLITLIIYAYNKTNDLLEYINTEISTSIFTIPFQVLQSLGVISALSDFFSVFTFVFIALLSAIIAKIAVVSLSQISDEFYKIGVLLQLGIK
jgi:hypothetical protein